MTGPETWPAEVFDRIYAASDDPWRYQNSAYERAKYADTLHAIPDRIRAGLEIGCSIGVMTAMLAPRCNTLLALDGAAAALERAAIRCAALPQVTLQQRRVPERFPDPPAGGWDLILLSEMLYFLSTADLRRLASLVARGAAPDAVIVLVNWTGATDTPCTGDAAAEIFGSALPGFNRTAFRRGGTGAETYRLDRLERFSSPAATTPG